MSISLVAGMNEMNLKKIPAGSTPLLGVAERIQLCRLLLFFCTFTTVL